MTPHRAPQTRPPGSVIIGAVMLGALMVGGAPFARADVQPDKKLAYLIGVTTRPGYNFASADEAFEYGYGICAKVARGVGYAQLMAEVQADFNTSDDYQGSYLISQAANELCPELIWQLRNSAAHYRPPAGTGP